MPNFGDGHLVADAPPFFRDAFAAVWLRRAIVGAGLVAVLLFPIVGLAWDLQLYADGSVFAYAVAVQESLAIHWHNIIGRVFVYLATSLPAETFVELTGSADGGLTLYGLLFFLVPALALAATFAADRSPNRIFLVFACVSTLVVCPLVFGFPTEMWFAHAVFWPLLAHAHHGRMNTRSRMLLAGGFAALVHTHGGGVIFAIIIVTSVLPRGVRHPRVVTTAAAFLVAMTLWISLQVVFRPDAEISGVLFRAAFNFIDLRNLAAPITWLLLLAIGGYAALASAARWRGVRYPHAGAFAVLCVLLLVYWSAWDDSLLTDDRYLMRTAILVVTPVFGGLACAIVMLQEAVSGWPMPLVGRAMSGMTSFATPRLLAGALVLVALVHTVETAQFVGAWSSYRGALQRLATGDASDPALGHVRFVSSARISVGLDGPSWSSTTHFLSIVGTPGHNPARLVVNPNAGYFWLSCALARRIRVKRRKLPSSAHLLIEAHACVHRP